MDFTRTALMLRFNQTLALFITSLCLFAIEQPARAHSIQSTLNYLDGSLELNSSFSTGTPAEGAMVRILKADGTPGQELGRMDAEGKLTLTLPPMHEGMIDLQVDGGPGHRDYLALPIRAGQVQLDEVVQEHHRPLGIMHFALTGAPLMLGCSGLFLRGFRSSSFK